MKNPLRKKQQPRRRAGRSSGLRVNSNASSLRKPPSEDGKKQRNKSKRKRQLIRVGVVGIVLLIGSVVIFQNMRITDVAVVVEQEMYRETVENYLNRNPLARMKVLISAQAIEDDLIKQYPVIENAEVVVPIFGNQLSFSVTERQAQLVLRTADDKLYLVDQGGFVYGIYDPATKNDKTVILTDDTRVEYDLGENRFIPSALVEFIEETNSILKSNKNYTEQTLNYRITDEARVIYIKPSNAKYEIKMQLDEPVEGQTESLFSALAFYKSKGIKPNQYIDVRVNGTVYYR